MTVPAAVNAQQKTNAKTDSAQKEERLPLSRRIRNAINDLYHQGYNSMLRSGNDSINNLNQMIKAKRSERVYNAYEGKIIRYIYIDRMRFEKVFSDTTSTIGYWGTRLLNRLHTDTKEWVIRNNLFIKENQPLSPYKLSDNERYLRSLPYIQDARITIMPVPNSQDSVDILVITKDLFSLSGIIDADATSIKGRASEDNLAGLGQSVRITGLYDMNRDPRYGYEFRYGQNNIGGTFVNGEIGYSRINNSARVGGEQEDATFLRLSRQLVSPYSHLAGGAEISSNTSENVYNKPDSLFYSYHYNYYMGWIGYNLGRKRDLEKNTRKRERQFFALGYMNTVFSENPYQVQGFDPMYNNKQYVLGTFTFFKENFYKGSYIYGFGTTEDLPMGYNITATGGWYKQLSLERPYAGFTFNFYHSGNNGYFAHYYSRIGAFYHDQKLEDITFLVGADAYSPLFTHRSLKMRQYIRLTYSRLANRVIYEPLRINNSFGLRDYNGQFPVGQERLNLNSDFVVYTNFKIFGFRFAPFVYTDLTVLRPDSMSRSASNLYSSFGGGVRARNPNFIFGTIEARCSFFPVSIEGSGTFKINVSSELQYRYRTNYVQAPAIIQLNQGL